MLDVIDLVRSNSFSNQYHEDQNEDCAAFLEPLPCLMRKTSENVQIKVSDLILNLNTEDDERKDQDGVAQVIIDTTDAVVVEQ